MKPHPPVPYTPYPHLTRSLIVLLMLLAAWTFAALVARLCELLLVVGINEWGFAPDANLVALLAWSDTPALLQWLTGWVAWGLFLYWCHLANQNAHALGADGMEFTPGWAVIWFFVPLMNLYKPYRMVRELWLTSRHRERWRTQPASPRIRLFWILAVAAGLIPQIGEPPWRTGRAGEVMLQAPQFIVSHGATVVSDLLLLIALLLLVTLVREIHDGQAGRLAPPTHHHDMPGIESMLHG